MKLQDLQKINDECFFTLHSRLPIMIVKGKGVYMWDENGKEYLDFCSGGRAVCGLGHCPESVVNAIKEQADVLLHTSNDFYTEPQFKLAKLLVENSDFDKVFFCNSGAEANEAALKLARKYGRAKNKGKIEIVSTLKSFHGRTFGAITATGQPKYQEDFAPLVPGFKYVPYNDIEAMREVINENTCAVIIEPVQGESGVYIADKEYMQSLRELCDKFDVALIVDEVQAGLGRTGKLFAYQHYGILPDIMTLSKSIGGGVPLGAMMANDKVGSAFKPGDHATTFGGSPIVAVAGIAAISTIIDEKLADNAKMIGEYISEKIDNLSNQALIKEKRVLGCMVAIDLNEPKAAEIQAKALENGLVILTVGDSILRLLPALIIKKEDVDKAFDILNKIM